MIEFAMPESVSEVDFAEPAYIDPNDFKRDGYTRPLILVDGAYVPYARVSTVSARATDQEGLHRYKMRWLALAVGKFPDLAGLFAASEYGTHLDRWINEALVRIDATQAANWGTVTHLFTEPDRVAVRAYMPGKLTVPIENYEDSLKANGLELIATEVKIVNDKYKVAGSMDHAYRVTKDIVVSLNGHGFVNLRDKVIAGDKKTGRVRPINWAAQLAGYAGGVKYDPLTDLRSPIHEDWEPRVGVSANIPLDGGGCGIKFLDLVQGEKLLAAARILHAMANGRDVILQPI